MKGLITIAALLFFVTAQAQTVENQVRPFSNYTEHSGLIFVSGQIGNQEAGFKEEVRQAIRNVEQILKEAGSSLEKVVSVTVYLKNIKQINEFNSIYSEYFRAPFPVRTCVAVKDLVRHANLEISVIAGKQEWRP